MKKFYFEQSENTAWDNYSFKNESGKDEFYVRKQAQTETFVASLIDSSDKLIFTIESALDSLNPTYVVEMTNGRIYDIAYKFSDEGSHYEIDLKDRIFFIEEDKIGRRFNITDGSNNIAQILNINTHPNSYALIIENEDYIDEMLSAAIVCNNILGFRKTNDI